MNDDDPEFDASLDAALIGGREEREVVIVDYSPAWPVRFEAERRRIGAALGPVARRLEHVGSTAVPGLAAKPVVDIMVTVADPDDEAAYGPALEAAGYLLRVREPGHRMFRTPERDVHVHIWPAGGEDERRQLAFRDRLRSNAADRAEYERTKRELAGRWRDMNYYARAKGPVIERILERAGPAPTRRADTPGRGDG
ncbi:MAG TPA: GrpB family protein [Acidimicrobiales bacterium]|nr:GrpB family protein [Acidimicrobiales bacterium]